MRALILTALELEHQAVVAHLSNTREVTGPEGTTYAVGRFEAGPTWDVCVVETGPGNARSAAETTRGSSYFRPDVVLFVGVAGSLKKEVKLGDVVAGSSVVSYESGKDQAIFLPRGGYGLASYRLEQRARSVRRLGAWQQRLPNASVAGPPDAHVAVLATGEKVVASLDSATIRLIKQSYSQAYAVEMEGGGFHEAAHQLDIAALVVRGISDLCDEDKGVLDASGSQQIAAAAAAAFAMEVLATYEPPQPGPAPASMQLALSLPPAVLQPLAALQAEDGQLADGLTSALVTHGGSRSELASELIMNPPSWMLTAPTNAWIVLAYYAISYGAAAAASVAAERVARMVEPADPRWLVRAAGYATTTDSSRAAHLAEEAALRDPAYPLARAMTAALRQDNDALAAVAATNDLDDEETLSLMTMRAGAFEAKGDSQESIKLLEGLIRTWTGRAGIRLQLAQVLTRRAANSKSWDRTAELARARDLALSARDLIREWGGDTVPAVTLACNIAVEQGDARAALSIGLPAPDGEATPEEASSPPVLERVAGAAVIAGQLDILRSVVDQISDPYQKHLYQASIARREKSDPKVVIGLLNQALLAATTDTQRFGPLYQLADLGVEPLPGVDQLPPELAAQVQAASDMAHARYELAQTRLRGWSDQSIHAARSLAHAYEAAGRTDLALDTYRSGAVRLQAPELLVDAVDLATNQRLDDVAVELAREALLVLQPNSSAVGHLRRRLVELAARNRSWRDVEENARAILRDAPESPVIRWALVVALFNQARLEEAWRAMDTSPLEPLDQGQARIKVMLLTQFRPTAESVSEVLSLMERFRESEEFLAGALGAIYQIKPEPQLPDHLVESLHASLNDFFERYPSSQILKKFTLEKPTDILAYVEEQLAKGSEELAELTVRVSRGEVPYGLLAAVSHRPYSLTLLTRAAGFLVSQPEDPAVILQDRSAATDATQRVVVADTSAIVVGVQSGRWDVVSRELHRLAVVNLATFDIVEGNKQAASRSTMSVGLDAVTKKARLFEMSAREADRIATSAESVLAIASALDQIVCNDLTRFPAFDVIRHGAWLGPIQAAANQSAVLYSDDWVVRALAREAGVPAFGTLGLIDALVSRGRLSTDEAEKWRTSLVENLVGDLPLEHERIRRIASAEQWASGSAWVAVGRPATWHDPAAAFQAVTDLLNDVAKAAAERLPDWLSAVCRGGVTRFPGPYGTQLAARLTVFAMNTVSLSPDRTPVLLEAARQAVAGTQSIDPLPEMTELLFTTARQIMPPSEAVQFVLRIFAETADPDRALVTQMLLGRA